MRISFITYEDSTLANVFSIGGTLSAVFGAYLVSDKTAIGILLIVLGVASIIVAGIVARNEKKRTQRYIYNKDGTYTCNDCGSIITKIPCENCEKKHIEFINNLYDAKFCLKCGADISKDKDTCHVCGETIV